MGCQAGAEAGAGAAVWVCRRGRGDVLARGYFPGGITQTIGQEGRISAALRPKARGIFVLLGNVIETIAVLLNELGIRAVYISLCQTSLVEVWCRKMQG